jgi:hypothetical protein
LLARDDKDGENTDEVDRSFDGAESAGVFLTELHHPDVGLGVVIRVRNTGAYQESQDIIPPLDETPYQAMPNPASLSPALFLRDR